MNFSLSITSLLNLGLVPWTAITLVLGFVLIEFIDRSDSSQIVPNGSKRQTNTCTTIKSTPTKVRFNEQVRLIRFDVDSRPETEKGAGNSPAEPDPNEAMPEDRIVTLGRSLHRKLLDKEAERKQKLKAFSNRIFRRKTEEEESTEAIEIVDESDPKPLTTAEPKDRPKPAASVPKVKITIKTQPVVYHVSYSEEIQIRKTEKFCGFGLRNNLVKVHNKNFNYSYKSEADLLRRDWERALEKHSESHPVTFNGAVWTTSGHARGMVNQKMEPKPKRFGPTSQPLRKRLQLLRITKVYANEPDRKTIYELNKTSSFYPYPYEHLIKYERPARNRNTEYRSVKHLMSRPKPCFTLNYASSQRAFGQRPSHPCAPSAWSLSGRGSFESASYYGVR